MTRSKSSLMQGGRFQPFSGRETATILLLDADGQVQEDLKLGDHLVLHHRVVLGRLFHLLGVCQPHPDDLLDEAS